MGGYLVGQWKYWAAWFHAPVYWLQPKICRLQVCWSASGIFSGVFRIWKMWVHRVCGTGPRNIFRCIYDFENVGALGFWDRPPVYFWAFWKCRCMGLWGKFYVSGLRILKINSRISNLLDAGFLCFNRSGAFQQYQYTYIIYYSQLRVFCP